MANIQLKNSQINSNTFVDLQATSFKPTYKRRTKSEPVVGQNPADSSDGHLLIPEADDITIEAPVFMIKGVISTAEYADNTALHATSSITVVTLGFLKLLERVRADSTSYIQIWFGEDSTKSWKNYLGTSDDIKVAIDSIDFDPAEDAEGNHLVRYTLMCKETT